MLRFYRQFDRNRFGDTNDPWKTASIHALPKIGDVKMIDCPAPEAQYVFGPKYITQLELDPLDVALYFGEIRLAGAIIDMPRYGTWSLGPTSALKAQTLRAVLQQEPIIETTLWKLGHEASADQSIYRSYTGTHPFSENHTNSAIGWKASHFMYRKLRDLSFGSELVGAISQPVTSRHAESFTEPRTRSVVPLLGRYLKEKVADRISFPHWMIAYRASQSPLDELNDNRWVHLEPPARVSWADPFQWEQDGKLCIFVEEIPDVGARGHIAVFDLSDINADTARPTTVIKQDYHMSYPFLFSWKGSLFMLPETKANQTIEVYRCKHFPYEWELETNLFEQIAAVDTTLYRGEDFWWMFTYIPIENTGGHTNDELSLFFAPSPFGPWKAHPKNPIVSNVQTARPAGALFSYKNSLIRPGQDCSKRYGYAVTLNRVLKMTPHGYAEEVVSQIRPTWSKRLLATHTFNWRDGLVVLDGYRRPLIRNELR